MSRLISFCFGFIIFTLASDLNGFLSNVFGTERIFSLAILIVLIPLLWFAIKVKVGTNRWLILLVVTIVLWLLLGSLILSMSDVQNKFDKISYYWRYYTPSILMVFTFTKIFGYLMNSNAIGKYSTLILISIAINAILILVQTVSGFGVTNPFDDRSNGVIASINQAGVTMCIGQIIVLHKWGSFGHSFRRIGGFLFLLYLLFMVTAILTFSKAAILNTSLITFLFLYRYLGFRKSISRSFLRVLVLTLFFISVLPIISQIGLTKVQTERINEFTQLFFKGEITDETTTGRTTIANKALGYIANDYFLGRGIGTFHKIDGKQGSHNEYLLILGEAGFIVVTLYLLFWGKLLFSILRFKAIEDKHLILGIGLVFIITNMVSHTFLFIKFYMLILSYTMAFIDKKMIRQRSRVGQ